MTTIHPPLGSRWERIQQLFARATELPPHERDVFLTSACGNDESLRQELNDLLEADSADGRNSAEAPHTHTALPSPLTHAVNLAIEKTTRDRRAELIGSVVGSYRLTSVLGHGGAGTVYLGERADRQYSAHVAIKVVANALLNDDVQRRFQSERQILANLNHPNIARLLDAGETKQGQPFLVMEYVHGETIDHYCDHNKLSITQRLQLFVKVCQAVQYAHRNLVVHRDLKPGNILVTPDGTPKLLDFGIAKLLDESALAALKAGQTLYTRINDRLLTPEYASPEQILGQTVTTTSDVYTLGIVLYELLAGVRPYQVNATSQLELERSICVIDPVRPSQMLAKLLSSRTIQLAKSDTPVAGVTTTTKAHADVQAIATARNISTKRLRQKLSGDIDAIVMRALRKEAEQRYSSVEQLVDDIERYLDQQPVLARQGNWAYYSKRFVRRHALGAAMTSLALMALVSFAVVMSIQAKRIAEQRDKATQESARAESVSEFMQEVFTAADPYHSQDKEITAKELLDRAAQRISSDLNQQPEVRARLLEAIGMSYDHQGQTDSSVKYLEDSLRLQRQLPSQDNVHLAAVLDHLGRAYYNSDNFEAANRVLSEARSVLEQNNRTQSAEYLQVLSDSGHLEHALSHLAAAKTYYQQGLNLSRHLYGNYHPETATMLLSLAQVFMWQSKYREAEDLDREAVEIYHATLPDKHPDRVMADMNLGQLLYRTGQLNEAANLVSHSLADQQAVFGNDNPRLITAYDTLAMIEVGQLKWESAERNARKEVSLAEKNLGRNTFDTGVSHSVIAGILLKEKKYRDAEDEARASLKILQATAPPDHQYIASAEYLLASALVATQRSKEAEPLLRANIDRWTRAQAPAWRAARSESLLGVALLQLKKPTDAAPLLTHAYEVLSAKDSGADADAIATAHIRVEQYQQCEKQHQLLNCQLTE